MTGRKTAFVGVSLAIMLQAIAGQGIPSNSVFIKRALPMKKTHIMATLDSSEETFLPLRNPVDTMKAASVRIVDPSILLPPESRRPTTPSYAPSYEEPTLPPYKRQILYEAGTPEQDDQFPLAIAEGNSGSGSVKHYNYNSDDCNKVHKCVEQTKIGVASVAPECQDKCNYELVEKRTFICRPKDTVIQLLKSKASKCDSMAAAASSSSNSGRIGVIENVKNTVPVEIIEIDEYFRH